MLVHLRSYLWIDCQEFTHLKNLRWLGHALAFDTLPGVDVLIGHCRRPSVTSGWVDKPLPVLVVHLV